MSALRQATTHVAAAGQRADYRPISDYGLIGNTHSAALIASDGSIDWCCLPHFDSGAVFCRLLDGQRGGYFRIRPRARFTSRRSYRGSTVLRTEFETSGGRACVSDFMHSPAIAESNLGREDPRHHRVLRRVEGLAGDVELEVALRPTFDYARAAAGLSLIEGGALMETAHERLRLRIAPAVRLRCDGDTLRARLRLRAGQVIWLVLAYAGKDGDERALEPVDADALLEETLQHWVRWERTLTYDGPYEPVVRQSARVLKLLTFSPTGALVAAPTSSLPEEVGGARNWDYRFCWLRDAALVLNALMAIGQRQAALDFFRWLEDLCEGECEHLQIMYRLDRGRDLPEQKLDHLAGYRDSRPVRIGNAAASQPQLDVYGHVLDAAWYYMERMLEPEPVRPGLARMLRFLADQAASRWREQDHSLWEVRAARRHFVSSKLMCWVALDRAVRLARGGHIDGDVESWARECNAVRDAIERHGTDKESGAFVRAFGASGFDASTLLMPLVGFLPAGDPRMRATVRAVQEKLSANGLVYRYLDNDGVPGSEATFAMCSCWLVDNLALQGRVDEARGLFERILSYGSDLGLFAEQIDPVNHQLLGNYPQGFTHLALIKSALTIAKAERR